MADTLPDAMFLADSLGLDFLNSVATPVDRPVEWLLTGEHLLKWLEQGKLVRTEVLAVVRRDAGPGELDAVAAQARALREWFRTFVLEHKGERLSRTTIGQLEPLNRLLARDEVYGQIETRSDATDEGSGSDLAFVTERRWRSADSLLLPIAKAMADLLTNANFTYVKQCKGPACTLLFLDTTRGHIRRWCSMAVCGNRAKQLQHRNQVRPPKQAA